MKLVFQENTPLAPFTTFGVGGVARFFAEVTSKEEVQEAIEFAREHSLPIFVLGGGSNIVIADSGWDGLVLRIRIIGIEEEKRGERVVVTAGAGVVWDDLVRYSIEHELYGLECLSGVPGTVGGAVVANLGAYGAQVSDTFVQAEVLDLEDPQKGIQIVQKESCNFSYHDSMFSHTPKQYVIVRATFALSHDPSKQPSYKDNRFDMAKLAAGIGHTPTQAEVREAVLTMREEKGSLIMSGRASFKCAGSFFHMPFVSEGKYREVEARARALDAAKEEMLRPWAWKQADGSYKLAPGFLLEYTPFKKGYVHGEVGVSPRHTLSIINVGSASASEVAALARDMQAAVQEKFGIELEREVEYVGDFEK